MAQYRFSVQSPISRGKGQSAVAKAAYIAREEIRDERTGELKDFSRRHDEVLFSGIFVDPKQNAPAWVQDRAALWNAASAAEKRKDAREAQEIILNLPHELTQEQREWLLKDFVREQLTRNTGRGVDVSIHAAPTFGDNRNIHAHLLLSLRSIGPEGFGDRLPEVSPQQIEHWRERWAGMGARALDRAGFHQEAERYRVEHLSLERQRQAALERGDLAHAETLDREATKHLGPQAAAMERKNGDTDRGNAYRDTIDHNTVLVDLKSQLAEVETLIQAERGRIAEAPVLDATAAKIGTAYQRSDTPQAFAAALREQDITIARVSTEDAQRSHTDSAVARTHGHWRPAYREGELVAVTERGHIYRLTPRTTGEKDIRQIQRFSAGLDVGRLPSLADALESASQRREKALMEKAMEVSGRNRGREMPSKDPAGREMEARAAAVAGRALETVANIAGEAIEILGDMFGATAMTPERIQAVMEAKETAAEHRLRDWQKLRAQDYETRSREAQQAQKLQEEQQRKFYERGRDDFQR